MIAQDNLGRPYALVSETSPNDMLEADDGFTCMKEGERKVVFHGMYIKCDEGSHMLDSQVETKCKGVKCQPFYLGLYKVDQTCKAKRPATVIGNISCQ